jgi:hypothetical protein
VVLREVQRMSDAVSRGGPPGAPPKKDLPEAFRELLENLNYASHLFETEEDAGRKGIVTACHAVARFIAVTHQPPLLAAPLLAVRAAIFDVEQGVSNPIIDLDDGSGRRSRSALKKHAIAVAAVCLEVLVERGNPVDEAASRIARKADRWRIMRGQEVSQNTVKNWRNVLRGAPATERAAFDQMRNYLLTCDNAGAEIDKLLRDGPPGVPKT